MIKYILFVTFLLGSFCIHAQIIPVNIVPRPQKTEIRLGYFEINGHTTVLAPVKDSAAWAMAKQLVAQVYRLTGLRLLQLDITQNSQHDDTILFTTNDENSGDEGYTLEISPGNIVLTGHSGAGLFYAWQSFEQLMPAEIMATPIPRVDDPVRLQALFIEDHPRFGWRGMHLDVSRHFFDKEFIKQYLDYLAMLKMNVFHWHLTDSQGWRIEIKKYPRLTQTGAFRVQRPGERFAEALPQKPGELVNYGGYYTQADIKEVIAYASARHIAIVPEIDMPGHCMAALVAYPQFASIPGPLSMPSGRVGAYNNSFNPGNDSTYLFLQDILTEVMDLFPGDYIHIGGDEVDRNIWKDNLLCQEKMRKENLKSLDELQSYFIRRIEAFIHSKGKKMIGWDEIIAGGLAPEASVMSWHGYKGGVTASKTGHYVVMAPAAYAYFDLYQGDPELEPEAYSRNLLSTSYQFDPMPSELRPEAKKFILGGQGCLWTETVPDAAHVQHMLFPRILALAESVWTQPERKNFEDFRSRLLFYMKRLDLEKINYARSALNVWIRPVRDTAEARLTISCSNELGMGKIFYTVDGSIPGPGATLYTVPFRIAGNTQVKAAAFMGTELISVLTTEQFMLSATSSKPIHLGSQPALRFAGYNSFTLSDGIRGSENPFDGRWLGFTGSGLTATIDLGKLRTLKNIGFDFMDEPGLSVYLPRNVSIEVSDDGRSFISLMNYTETDLRNMRVGNIARIYREFAPVSLRYLRLTATGREPGAADDGKTYLLIDEISAN